MLKSRQLIIHLLTCFVIYGLAPPTIASNAVPHLTPRLTPCHIAKNPRHISMQIINALYQTWLPFDSLSFLCPIIVFIANILKSYISFCFYMYTVVALASFCGSSSLIRIIPNLGWNIVHYFLCWKHAYFRLYLFIAPFFTEQQWLSLLLLIIFWSRQDRPNARPIDIMAHSWSWMRQHAHKLYQRR